MPSVKGYTVLPQSRTSLEKGVFARLAEAPRKWAVDTNWSVEGTNLEPLNLVAWLVIENQRNR